jgi:hypothetical protein
MIDQKPVLEGCITTNGREMTWTIHKPLVLLPPLHTIRKPLEKQNNWYNLIDFNVRGEEKTYADDETNKKFLFSLFSLFLTF